MTVAAIFVALLSGTAEAQDIDGSTDHPLIGRFQGSAISAYEYREFDEYKFPAQKVGARATMATSTPQSSSVRIMIRKSVFRSPSSKRLPWPSRSSMPTRSKMPSPKKAVLRCTAFISIPTRPTSNRNPRPLWRRWPGFSWSQKYLPASRGY
jgi:hypothetical protein